MTPPPSEPPARRRTPRVLVALTSALLAVPLAGAGGAAAAAAAPAAAPVPAVEAVGADRVTPLRSSVLAGTKPVDYVALGDSFSAGPLIPAQRPDPIGCLRSTNNYPAYLAGYFKVRSYVDVTCSAAETADVDRRAQRTIIPGASPKPQVSAISAGTDLVTIGIGGNDYALFGSMITVCESLARLDPHGSPCRRHFTVKGVDTKLRDAARIQQDVTRTLRVVRQKAPNAEVYVVGYPRLLPEQGTCRAVRFAAGDYRWGDRVQRRLNESLRAAARATGAAYVDLYPASRGRDACAGNAAWINGSTLRPLRAANYHPFLRGMRGMAQEAYRQLTGGRTAPRHVLAQPPLAASAPGRKTA